MPSPPSSRPSKFVQHVYFGVVFLMSAEKRGQYGKRFGAPALCHIQQGNIFDGILQGAVKAIDTALSFPQAVVEPTRISRSSISFPLVVGVVSSGAVSPAPVIFFVEDNGSFLLL